VHSLKKTLKRNQHLLSLHTEESSQLAQELQVKSQVTTAGKLQL
jgi:hypothetical protein